MSVEKVQKYFDDLGLGDRIIIPEASSATVEEAALAIGCEPKEIAKTMSFLVSGEPMLIVTAGDAKVDNAKYKAAFHEKARMIPGDQVEGFIGHPPGGVCPFAIDPSIPVYLDVSLKRFDTVYPAAGSGHSAVRLSVDELERYSGSAGWVDVCKGWEA